MNPAQPLPAVLEPAAAPAVSPFRRGRGVLQRRQRSLLLALLLRGAGPLAVLAVPAAGVAWVLTAPAFALASFEVQGPTRVGREWVQAELAPLVGENLVRLPLWQVESRLVAHPWIESVALHKQLPNRIEITITERTPAAVLLRDGIAWWADREGHLIDRVGADEPVSELPRLVEVGAGARGNATSSPAVPMALQVLADLARVAPSWAEGLEETRLLSDAELEIATGALAFPLRLRAGQLQAKVRALQRILPEIERRYARLDAIDLRFSRRIVVSPTSPRDLAALEAAAKARAEAEAAEEVASEEPLVEGDPGELVRPLA